MWVRRTCRAMALFAGSGVLFFGCATTDSVQQLDSQVAAVEADNEVQNQRLADLERGTGAAFGDLEGEVTAMREELAAARAERDKLASRLQAQEGSTQVLTERVNHQEEAVKASVERSERTQGELAQLSRRQRSQEASMERARTEQLAELDAVLQHLTALQATLQSPIGDLPSITEADKLFREAHGHVLHGELDLAADKFREFQDTYPDDPRVVEAQYRQAQSYFLARKYDHALVPSVALVKNHPDHERAEDARWFLARSLEETGDFALARRFYAEMIDNGSPYRADALRRVHFLNELQPETQNGNR